MHMKQNAIIPIEHQYSHNATETLMIYYRNAKLLSDRCTLSTKLPPPNLPASVNFVEEW